MSSTPPSHSGYTAIATWIQTVAVVASLLFINVQLNQQIKLSKAANAQAFVRLGQPLNLKLTEADTAKLWLKKENAAEKKGEPTEADIDDARFDAMLANFLTFYENIYVQFDQGLVTKEIFELWDKDIEYFVLNEPMEDFWANSKDAYQVKFRAHVDELLQKKHKSPSP